MGALHNFSPSYRTNEMSFRTFLGTDSNRGTEILSTANILSTSLKMEERNYRDATNVTFTVRSERVEHSPLILSPKSDGRREWREPSYQNYQRYENYHVVSEEGRQDSV